MMGMHTAMLILTGLFTLFQSSDTSLSSPTIDDLKNQKLRIPIGLIIGTEDHMVNVSFRYAIAVSKRNVKKVPWYLDPVAEYTVVNDSFKMGKAVCSELAKGIFTLVALTDTASYTAAKAFSDTFQMPMITTGYPVTNKGNIRRRKSYQINIRPDYTRAIYDIVRYYKWDVIHYLFDSDEGLLNLEKLFNLLGPRKHFLVIPRLLSNRNQTETILDSINKGYDAMAPKRIVIDCKSIASTQALMNHLSEKRMTTKYFHYLIAAYGSELLDLSQFGHDGANVTGLRIMEKSGRAIRDFYRIGNWENFLLRMGMTKAANKFIDPNSAIIYDSVTVIMEAYNRLLHSYPNTFQSNFRRGEVYNMGNRGIGDCLGEVTPWERGDLILRYLKEAVVEEGLTGHVEFDENGMRVNYTINVWEFTLNRVKAWIGQWSPLYRYRPLKPNIYRDKENYVFENKTRIITSILSEPYLMLVKGSDGKPNKTLTGNERYTGYCADLMIALAKAVEFHYEIREVADGAYGAPTEDGTSWNGMIGELIDGEADMAIAPLTITAEREEVVDFSKPFMSMGISIMIKKPEPRTPGVFSFMNPLSYEIWMCIVFAMIGVSVVLFLVSRFSPYEWRVEYGASGVPEIINDFNIFNSLWFSLGAFMQQGCDISPRSVSGRIVGSVWWFFTLIMISSYTANLAAFLTVERMNAPIESAEDLANQIEIQYGTLDGGSTYQFFRKSKIPTYKRMWSFMSTQKPSVFVPSTKQGIRKVRSSKGKYAFLLESTTNDYQNTRKPCNTMKVGSNLDSKGFGVATPLGSDLREKITFAVLKLREDGALQKLKNRWWINKSECPKEEKQVGKSTELGLRHVAGIFYILIGGLVLAIITSVAEYTYRRSVDDKRSSSKKREEAKESAEFDRLQTTI